MRIAFIVDPLNSLNPKKDSSIAMMREAFQKGHEIFAILQPAIFWEAKTGVCARATRLKISNDNQNWYAEKESATLPLREFSAVIMRKDPPFDMEYVTSTWLLEQAEKEGAKVFNRPRAIRDHSEKLALMEFAQFAAPTLVSREASVLNQFMDAEGETILKPLDGMGGSQIFRVHKNDKNRNVIIETLTLNESRTIMAQGFIPEISAGDKRILLIAGKVVPFALARIPKEGETRGNLAAGGTGIAQKLSKRDLEIAEFIAPIVWKRGLFLVGIDVIGDYLTEVNVTSPTCMVQIYEQQGFNVAEMFITELEKACLA